MEVLTIQQTAELLQFSYEHTRRLVANGEIPSFRVGSSTRVNGDALRKKFCLDNHTQVSEQKEDHV